MAKPIDFEVDTNKLITDEMLTSQNMTTISPDHTANQTPCQTTYNTSYQNNSYNYVQSSSISHNDIRSQTIPHITQDKKDITGLHSDCLESFLLLCIVILALIMC